MKALTTALFTIAALSACQTGGTAVNPDQRVTSHASLAASVGDNFIWDCALNERNRGFPSQFIVQRQNAALRPFTMMLEAGTPRPQQLEMREMNFAKIYTLPDSSGLLISSSGEVFGLDARGVPVSGEAVGQCRKGAQPA